MNASSVLPPNDTGNADADVHVFTDDDDATDVFGGFHI